MNDGNYDFLDESLIFSLMEILNSMAEKSDISNNENSNLLIDEKFWAFIC